MIIGRFLNASMAMLLALTVLSVPYSAIGAEQANPVAKACVADIKAKCAGQDSVKDCLITHFGELYANCKAALLKVVAMAKACRTDIKKQCPDVKLGGGRVQACMESHLADVSEPCKEAMGKAAAGNK
jgi:Cysteine rich repeat